MVRRWWGLALAVVAAGVVAVTTMPSGNRVVGAVVIVLTLAAGLLVSPLLFPRGPAWATAEQQARTRGVPLILWKPGCGYCVRLRLALGTAGSQAVWSDISTDPDAAAATRELNDGNETTPTVITADGTRTNPDPSWVKDRLPGQSRS